MAFIGHISVWDDSIVVYASKLFSNPTEKSPVFSVKTLEEALDKLKEIICEDYCSDIFVGDYRTNCLRKYPQKPQVCTPVVKKCNCQNCHKEYEEDSGRIDHTLFCPKCRPDEAKWYKEH